MNNKQLVYMYIITGRKQKDTLAAELTEHEAVLISFVYGKGCHESRSLIDYLGFAGEDGKVIISCLIPKEKSLLMIDLLNEKYSFEKPNSGIAFTVPVERLVF